MAADRRGSGARRGLGQAPINLGQAPRASQRRSTGRNAACVAHLWVRRATLAGVLQSIPAPNRLEGLPLLGAGGLPFRPPPSRRVRSWLPAGPWNSLRWRRCADLSRRGFSGGPHNRPVGPGTLAGGLHADPRSGAPRPHWHLVHPNWCLHGDQQWTEGPGTALVSGPLCGLSAGRRHRLCLLNERPCCGVRALNAPWIRFPARPTHTSH